jgi:RHS repeat-associated protein
VSRSSTGTNSVHYLLEDHEGSSTTLTNSDGSLAVEESFDAYGVPRDPTTWSGAQSAADQALIAGLTRHGYTGHTMLGNSGLIHMNGRVMDASIGRFLSPDPYITEPGNTQNFNRYSYVVNNPMTYTDPTGFCGDPGQTPCVVPITAPAPSSNPNSTPWQDACYWAWFWNYSDPGCNAFGQYTPPSSGGNWGPAAQTGAPIIPPASCPDSIVATCNKPPKSPVEQCMDAKNVRRTAVVAATVVLSERTAFGLITAGLAGIGSMFDSDNASAGQLAAGAGFNALVAAHGELLQGQAPTIRGAIGSVAGTAAEHYVGPQLGGSAGAAAGAASGSLAESLVNTRSLAGLRRGSLKAGKAGLFAAAANAMLEWAQRSDCENPWFGMGGAAGN